MLLPPQSLSEAARRQFTLFTNPFAGEVTSDAEMFVNGNIRFVREVAWQAAMGARMAAIVGESGAGKTTMLDDLKEKILREHKSVVCIEPSMEGAEETDTKGKTVKAVDIHTAIVRTFDARASVASNAEARSRQVYTALFDSCTAGQPGHQ
ncbi:MAG: ATP-binding protein [Burkholderiales bacterium]|nr:ATP-binding protein [Burkholderiales bacterium]